MMSVWEAVWLSAVRGQGSEGTSATDRGGRLAARHPSLLLGETGLGLVQSTVSPRKELILGIVGLTT